MICLLAMKGIAQVYGNDIYMQMPTRDLYDTDMMSMSLRHMAETAARREANFHHWQEKATEAYKKKQWNFVIYYVNNALETQYYNGDVFFLRGSAYEELGNIRAAKRDYKKGKKYNCQAAIIALKRLKEQKK